MFIIFDNHIFICTNQRSGIEILRGGETLGLELVTEYKKQLKDLNINLKIRVNRSGCLGICNLGPTIVIYPEGTYYVDVKKEDVNEIISSHIVNRIPLERLLLKEWKK